MRIRFVLLSLVLSIVAPACASAIPSFPGAQGYGAGSVGGRGGDVYVVDTLADSGPGSLRECVEATGPRTCVFGVSGTIELRSTLKARAPYLTIAGQTAPAPGIQIKYHPSPTLGTHAIIMGDASATTPLEDRTHDVIIRHIRFRPGFGDPNDTTIWRRQSADAIGSQRIHNVIIDHVEGAWAADENLNVHQVPSFNITISNSMLYEGLRDHSHGGLTCSDGVDEGCHSITWVGNLFHSNDRRQPSLPASGCIDFVNNIVSNQGVTATQIADNYGNVKVNVVGNTYRAGPSTGHNGYNSSGIFINDGNSAIFSPEVYAADNLAIGMPLIDPLGIQPNSTSPVCPLSVTPIARGVAEDRVYDLAGAWPRDSVADRIVSESQAGGGKIVFWPARTPGLAGVWPVYAVNAGPADQDQDGMPDAWETARGLSPSDPADRNSDDDGDGFTNLEEYLDERHIVVIGGEPPPPPPPVPTASLTASPPAISAGESSDLAWASANADSCAGTGFATGNATSGSASVSPTVTTTYEVDCAGAGGTASDSETVTVSSEPPPPPPSGEWRLPTAGIGDSGNGGTVAWSAAGSITADDGVPAQAGVGSIQRTTHWLMASGFDFGLDPAATIDGIEVRFGASSLQGRAWNITDVRLTKNGTVIGDDKAAGQVATAAETMFAFGGASDLWGTTWVPADSIGVVVSFTTATGQFSRVDIDQIEARVHAAGAPPPPPDTEAPSVPSGVIATVVSGSQVDLSWAASTDNVGVEHYTVWRDGVAIANVPGTSYADTGLTAATAYAYEVSATDAAGNESPRSSPPVTVTTPDDVPPSVPANLTADLMCEISLAWDAATDNVAVDRYRVYRDGAVLVEIDALSHVDAVPPGSYEYGVEAIDAAGNGSGPSTAVPIICG